jgi:nucleoid DNA-binding protein
MNETDFIRLVAKHSDFSIIDSKRFFDALEKAIYELVENHEGFTIQNVGVMEFAPFKARKVKGNPKFLDGKDKEYPETIKMFFRISNNLKKKLKQSKK